MNKKTTGVILIFVMVLAGLSFYSKSPKNKVKQTKHRVEKDIPESKPSPVKSIVKIKRNKSKRYDDVVKERKEVSVNEKYRQQTADANKAFQSEDYERAMDLYLELAENNVPEAFRRIGEMYHFALGQEKDYQEAYYWYLEAFERGDEIAPNKVGRLFLNGEGFNRDEHEALKWYEHSANRGYPLAMYNVAHTFEKSDELYAPQKALSWYQKAYKNLNCLQRESPFCKDVMSGIQRAKKLIN